ncbi:hypothetical protein EV690_0081 [Celerinatantimonas diazotrophica]|uniref:Uncharacterized protein n=1 Tax=Celerinatantimonas diazotrophica TaxID=412034 RepID=A0A4R1KI81_9GAMM|nr:hypothetical protein EV690_0081 [Celerinatantimonas diazotrophica]CAG9297052.1 hypothetical protein CEDIAZO_02214 [Celerinatantimonas diazotrophica]
MANKELSYFAYWYYLLWYFHSFNIAYSNSLRHTSGDVWLAL